MQAVRLIWRSLVVLALGSVGVFHAASNETWVEVRSPHFLAYSDAGESEARKALTGFEGIRSVFQNAFPGLQVDPHKPMIIIVAADEASMKRFLPGQFEGKDPKRPAGVFLMRADRQYAILRLDIYHQADQPYFSLFHEYTHSIVHQNFPSLPAWLDEGIADFYGATEIRSGQVYVGRLPTGRLRILHEQTHIPIETLLAVTHDSSHYKEGEKSGIFYAQSWAFVHYLFMDDQAKKAGLFQAYLKALSRATDPLEAAREAFGNLAALQWDLTRYSARTVFHFGILPLVVGSTDKEFQSRTLGDAEALVLRAEFLQYAQQEKESRSLLDQALNLAPKEPWVHVALGYGHSLRGEGEAARLRFEEAIRLGSQDFRASYYLATLAQARGGRDSEDSARVLGWLESARSLRPDFPGIHMALCRQYSRSPKDPAKAIQEGAMAVRLDPENLIYRANLGSACMDLDQEKEAKFIGDQLTRLAQTKSEKRFAEAYSLNLAQYLEQRKARANSLPATLATPEGNALVPRTP